MKIVVFMLSILCVASVPAFSQQAEPCCRETPQLSQHEYDSLYTQQSVRIHFRNGVCGDINNPTDSKGWEANLSANRKCSEEIVQSNHSVMLRESAPSGQQMDMAEKKDVPFKEGQILGNILTFAFSSIGAVYTPMPLGDRL